tara:strand:+ start:645 stop:1385 length:741 start_codon:yes stop_codon:yes gene_type:complete
MQDKIILITGGTRRIGEAICQKLHSEGMSLMIHYRSSEKEAQALQTKLNQIRPGSVALIKADLLDTAQLSILVNETLKHFGRIDSLINNASNFYASPIGKITEKSWGDLIGCNLKAPLFLSQAAAPHLKKQHGCIINIIDIHSEWPLKKYMVYSSAKGGLATLTKSLAIELAPEVRVNGISPGPILWPENGEWSDQISRKRIINKTLLKRAGDPNDIAKAVFFLISDAPYITGQILAVDGGRSINL